MQQVYSREVREAVELQAVVGLGLASTLIRFEVDIDVLRGSARSKNCAGTNAVIAFASASEVVLTASFGAPPSSWIADAVEGVSGSGSVVVPDPSVAGAGDSAEGADGGLASVLGLFAVGAPCAAACPARLIPIANGST